MNEETLFAEAFAIKSPKERRHFLDMACAGNVELRQAVEKLLSLADDAGSFLENSPVDAVVAELNVSESAAKATVAYESGSTHDDDPDATTFYTQEAAPMTMQQNDAEFETVLGYLEPSSKPDSIGRLGHYEVLEVIGRGAFGTVLRAFDEKLHRVVAIKVMSPEMASTSPARKRFIREAQSSAAIRHEHVVSVYAVEETPLPYLVMEFIPGETLQQRLDAHGPLDVPTVLHLGRQIAEGLAAAHAQELIHRDIKPGNILLETSVHDRVKITDFGLARAADDASLTQSGTIAGTPMYMSPEQVLGHKLDQRADLFSFGSVLYQMVSGRPPFRANGTLAVLKRVAEDTPRPIQEIIPETPQWLCDIIAKLHAKNPDDRYQSAREVADVLADCEEQFKTNSRLHDFSRIPRRSSVSSASWKWVAAAVVLLLPMIALAVTELAGVTKLFQPQATRDQFQPEIAPTPVVTVTTTPDTEGWVQLFNGKDLTGWKNAPYGKRLWQVENGNLVANGHAALHSEKDLQNFHLRVECKVGAGATLGIGFRSIPERGMATALAPTNVGSIWMYRYSVVTQSVTSDELEPPLEQILLSPTDWTTVEAIVVGNKATILVNGRKTAEKEIKDMPEIGDLRLTSTIDATSLVIRKVEIKELPREEANWVQLFNGQSLTGWTNPGYAKTNWTVENGNLVAKGHAALHLEQEFEDSHIRLEFKVSSSATLALGFRRQPQSGALTMIAPTNVGSLWRFDRDMQFQLAPPLQNVSLASSDWATLDAIVQGTRATILVNGTKTAEHDIKEMPERGSLVLAAGETDGIEIAIRKVEIKELPPSASPATETKSPPLAKAPFDAEQARAHQEAWAKHLGVSVEYTNSIGMKFMLIPPGEFTMGSTPAEIEAALTHIGEVQLWRECILSEAPQHKVILTQPVYLGVNEVTQAEYEKVMGSNPSYFSPMGAGKEAVAGMETSDFPVETVSWNDAATFCARLSQQEKLKPFYFRAGDTIAPLNGTGYRLPSEAEWEFACRAGTTTKYWVGDKDEDLVQGGWHFRNSIGRTHAVGELKVNPFGLADIHGNVWEWVQDGWDPKYYLEFQEKPAINPISPFFSNPQRVFRGGHWNLPASLCRPSNRFAEFPSNRDLSFGFRVSLPVAAVKAAVAASSDAISSVTTTAHAKRRFASDEWIDVIPLIDPPADKWDVPQRTGKNAWRIERGELVVGGDTLASKLVLPLDSDWPAFECELEFTRRAGDSGFNVNIPTKVGECPLLFDPTGTSGAFLGSRAKGVQLKTGAQLVTGERTTIRFDIHRQQDTDHVSVAFNGAAIGEWTGDRTTISYSYREGFPHERRVSLWIHPGGNEFVFHRIRIRMLDGGTAESLRPIPGSPPPAVVKQEPLPVTFTNSIGMEFVIVPKGKSWLGGGKDKLGDREVEILADFYLGKYEVTQEEWTQVMGENPCHFSRAGGGQEAVMEISDADLKRFPVETVSWDECQLFVTKLNQLENETGWVYRLPTATEWEYACRGGPMTDKAHSAFDFYFAKPTNNALREQASFGKNIGLSRTGKVGSHEANGLGIFDMHRNVWEWCDDTKEAADGNSQRVQMGGGWNHLRWRSAAANIESELPSHRSNALGLRLARVPSGDPSPEVKTPKQ